MPEVTVRMATLDDTAAITAIHTSNIERWQRMNDAGVVEDIPYERLRIYERWLYGGPWMSVETCAVHLTHLLRGAGLPMVAEADGQVVGHGEAFPGIEPEPFGAHLHVSVLYVHAGYAGQGVEQALLAHLIALGRERGCARICLPGPDAGEFYSGEGWRRLASRQRVSWPARTGQVFYQATPHPDDDPAQIRGWAMPLGREQSAHYEWVTRWPALWMGVPELRQQRVERFKFQVAGGSFFVMYTQSPYEPRWAALSIWTGTPLIGPMMTAINDKAHRLGFRRLESTVIGEPYAFLGPEVERLDEPRDVFSIEL